ncbi:MAG: hypothetical protein TR69_WS6001000505 [candidate division WS6 bacterium OLB20]|uniref:Uncharacterized protein n=1 Tax=candidate division WS6 bacterium OLB20 TaxID=1617426 RepID=A0A136LXX6_9BACT|nr:MAG: hypothetical protein TR69_WS6001000505 [candidate division WS6 bacterium OLB20]
MKKNAQGQIVSITSTDLLEILTTWNAVKGNKAGVPESANANEQILRDMMLMLRRNRVRDGTEVQIMQFAQILERDPLDLFAALLQIKQLPSLPDKGESVEGLTQLTASWTRAKARAQIDDKVLDALKPQLNLPGVDKLSIAQMESSVYSLISTMKSTGEYRPTEFQAAAVAVMQQLIGYAENVSDGVSGESMIRALDMFDNQRPLQEELKLQQASKERLFKDMARSQNLLDGQNAAVMLQQTKVEKLEKDIQNEISAGRQQGTAIQVIRHELELSQEQLGVHLTEIKRLAAEIDEQKLKIAAIDQKMQELLKRIKGR